MVAATQRRFVFSATAIIAGVFAGLILCEIALRVLGHAPWVYSPLRAGEPTVHESDPALGWRNRPGSYRIAPHTPGAPPLK